MEFQNKNKRVHLLVAEGQSLPRTHHRTSSLLSDHFGSPKFELFKSVKPMSLKGPWPFSVNAEDVALFQPKYRRHTVKHLRPASDME